MKQRIHARVVWTPIAVALIAAAPAILKLLVELLR
jgi:hypothetical protein